MLHLITEVGKPGKQELEKRHYPDFHNVASHPKFRPHGRRYIPHGYSDEFNFRPHPPFQEPQYTEAGPDWSSRLRWLPSPHNDEYPAEENWPEPWRSMRTFPWLTRRTVNEWTFYPEGYDVAMRCNFAGQHKASSRSQNELTHTMLYGRGRQVADKRGGLTEASPGDKSYQVVEYSPGFHKDGSTLPVVNFGGNHSSKPDTFVPLQPLPPIPRETYQSKQDRWRHLEEVQEVQALEIWRPATPLMSSGASHAQANAADHIHSSTSK